MIFTCTSRGNTRPNGLFLGSTNPRQSMMTIVKHGMGSLCIVLSYSWIPWTNPHLAPGLEVHPKKVYPWGVPPRVSSHGPFPPRDLSPPINSSHQVSKSCCALYASSFQFDQCCCSRWLTLATLVTRSSRLFCTPCQSPCL